MSWDRYSSVMEQYVIKTDVIASRDDYFMVTHMPFSNLEVFTGGSENGAIELMGEEAVYQRLIYNPEDIHRMIIVRGKNGSGKSHLIRWLRARFQHDTNRYNPEQEKIVFLRRLNNTIRGAITQILEEKIISDADMIARLRRFVTSADAKGQDEFKTEIYHSYINFVANDRTEGVYRAIECKGIQGFLYDLRVFNHLMRDEGAINRCYKAITAPSDSVFDGEAAFNLEDFALPKTVMRELVHEGSVESRDFAEQIYGNSEEIEKLVKYLNQFTPKVIQSCAEISSDSTKEVFKQLRQSLKNQGKGLTIFIEDFTAFTGIDSELITVLSAEHGGENSDICRVTAIIGITDAYYGQFKDNFTDRVQYQINVSENSYSTEEFLEQMTARYLNAIYCDTEAIEEWFAEGANAEKLPVSEMNPSYSWDYVTINNVQHTLFPFNKKSLTTLYSSLDSRTPRRFLNNVLRSQLKEFFDGQQYGNSKFPTSECIADRASQNVQMLPVHSSNIDKQNGLSASDITRLKLLLAVWGDRTVHNTVLNDEAYIGGVKKAFLSELGLASVEGVAAIDIADPEGGISPVPPLNPLPPKPVVMPEKERRYNNRTRDIIAWESSDSKLAFSADYRKWVLEFIQDAIDWQGEDIPAYLAATKLQAQANVYIEGQSQSTQPERAMIKLYRGTETKDILQAFCAYDYYGSWLFKEAVYYQLKLANWLEKNKADIKARVCDCLDLNKQWPVLQWCIAVEYITTLVLSRYIDKSSTESIAKCLLENNDLSLSSEHMSAEWQDVNQYIKMNSTKFTGVKTMLNEMSKTFMGTISGYKPTTVQFYRTLEVIGAIEKLQNSNWDISSSLPQDTKSSFVLSPADLLKELYPRVDAIVLAEIDCSRKVLDSLRTLLGGEITQDSLLATFDAISALFVDLNAYKIPYSSALKMKFDIVPIERAEKIMSACSTVDEAISSALRIRKLELLSVNPVEELNSFLNELLEVKQLAAKEKNRADSEIKNLTDGTEMTGLTADCIEYLSRLADMVENLEVIDNAG